MASLVSAAEFLKTIWGDSEGFAELTAIGKGGVKSYPWTYPGSVESLIASSEQHNKNSNVYMGVCLRREKWPRASGRTGLDGKQIIEHRGTEINALSSWVVWVEFDFLAVNGEGHKGRVVEPEMARKWLAEFALKPSIVVKSGGGIQVYWLLKEAAVGDDLWRVKAINKALVEHFTTVGPDGKKYGADTQSVDLARILRIPDSVNIKYTPPRPCQISWWHPETRYTLDDFDILNIVVEKPLLQVHQPLAPQGSQPTPHTESGANPSLPAPTGAARPTPALTLSPEDFDSIKENVQALWTKGVKHDMALCVAGMFAHANVCLESATAVIRAVAQATDSDAEKRCKDVLDTYNNFVSGREVAGKTTLLKLLKDNSPEAAHAMVERKVTAIANRLPKPPKPPRNGGGGGAGGGEADPDFQIKDPVLKFDSRPARWSVTIVTPEKEELTATIETINLMSFRLFQAFFYEETHYMLNEISQRRWKNMVGQAVVEVRETPKEARPEGAIESALEEFLGEAHENPELGLLTTWPGFDESDRFFKFRAFKDFLKEQNLRLEDRSIFAHLKSLGFKSGVKRFGPKTQRVWMQPILGGNGPQNGNGHGDGPAGPPEPPEPGKSPPDAPNEPPENAPDALELFTDAQPSKERVATVDVQAAPGDGYTVEDF